MSRIDNLPFKNLFKEIAIEYNVTPKVAEKVYNSM